MADTPQQAEGSVAGAAAGGEAPAPKAGGGLASYLPLIMVVLLMPVAAWVTLMIKAKMDKSALADAKEESQAPAKEGASHSSPSKGESHEKGKPFKSSKVRSPEMPVPLTREIVAFLPARAAEEGKPQDADKMVVLDSKGEAKDVAQPDKILANVANAGGRAYAVARVSLKGPGSDFVQIVNLNRERLLDVATGTLGSKTLEEIEKPGFRNVFRSELLALFNQVLGGNAVSEVVITEFVTQQ